jgi:hypothetical protein
LNRPQASAPPNPKQPVRYDEQQKPHKRRQQMEKIQITHSEVNSNRPTESRRPHHRNNLRQTPVQFGAPSHKK